MINSYIIINVSLRLPLVSYRYCIGEKTWVREVKWLAQGQIISDKQHQDRILIQCSSSHVVLPFLHFSICQSTQPSIQFILRALMKLNHVTEAVCGPNESLLPMCILM